LLGQSAEVARAALLRVIDALVEVMTDGTLALEPNWHVTTFQSSSQRCYMRGQRRVGLVNAQPRTLFADALSAREECPMRPGDVLAAGVNECPGASLVEDVGIAFVGGRARSLRG
jgi:hypothetical protein